MEVKEVRDNLINGIEDCYTQSDFEFIDKRISEIADENNLTMEDMDYYSYMNSSEMLDCIFSGKEFDKANFI